MIITYECIFLSSSPIFQIDRCYGLIFMSIINIGTKQNSKRIFFNFVIENNPFISWTTIHRAVDGEL